MLIGAERPRAESLAFRLLTMVLLGLVVAPPSAGACSLVSSSARGPWFHADGWVISNPSPWAQELDSEHLFSFYGTNGELRSSRTVRVDLLEGMAEPVHVAADGRALFRVSCFDGGVAHEPLAPDRAEEPVAGSRCGQLLELSADGRLLRSWPLPEAARSIPGHGWWSGTIRSNRLLLERVSVAPSEAGGASFEVLSRALHVAGAGRHPLNVNRPTWTLGSRSDVVLLLQERDVIRVVRWRPNGELGLDQSYPHAQPGLALSADDREKALGWPWQVAVSGSGEILLSGWQIHGDCSSDLPPSLVVLGADGALVRRIPIDARVESIAALGMNQRRAMVSTMAGLVSVDLDSGLAVDVAKAFAVRIELGRIDETRSVAWPPELTLRLVKLALAAPEEARRGHSRLDLSTALGAFSELEPEQTRRIALQELTRPDRAPGNTQRLFDLLSRAPWRLERDALFSALESLDVENDPAYPYDFFDAVARTVGREDDEVARMLGELTARGLRAQPRKAVSGLLALNTRGWGRSPLLDSLRAALPPDEPTLMVQRLGGLDGAISLLAELRMVPVPPAPVVERLNETRQLPYALALSGQAHADALEVLVERGLGQYSPPVDAFESYGERARLAVRPFIESEDEAVRHGVFAVLRHLGFASDGVARARIEAEAALAQDRWPAREVILLLQEAGEPIWWRLLELEPGGSPSNLAEAIGPSHLYGSVDLVDGLVRWTGNSEQDRKGFTIRVLDLIYRDLMLPEAGLALDRISERASGTPR